MSQSLPTEYPTLLRPIQDHGSAVKAFHRLYRYARDEDNQALATFAVYKALQKLEEEAISSSGSEAARAHQLAEGLVAVPTWVREGLWNSMETYVTNPKLPGQEASRRPVTFLSSLRRSWKMYSKWLKVYKLRQAAPSSVSKAIEKIMGGTSQPMRDAYNWFEGLKTDANARSYEDAGVELTKIEPRDLIPTGHLLKIFEKLEPAR